MKKMSTQARKWSRLTGKTLTILSFAIPVHAQPNMPTRLGSSGQRADMRPAVTDAHRDTTLGILTTAMAIMRDDQPFDPAQRYSAAT
jgi:hypothetical protein